MKSKLIFLLKLSITICLLYFAFSLVDYDQVLVVIDRIDSSRFCIALTLNFIGTILVKSFFLYGLLNVVSDRIVVFAKIVLINISLRFHSVVLPRPAVAVMRWYKYSKFCDAKNAFVIISYDALVYLITIQVIALVFILIDSTGHGQPYVVLLIGCLFGFCCLFVLSMLVSESGMILWLEKPFVPELIRKKIINIYKLITDISSLTISIHRITVLSLLTSIISFFFFIAGSYFLLLAVGIKIPFTSLVWIRILVMILAMMPVTVGGVGLREVGFVGLLAEFGVSAEEALIYSMSTFVLQLIIACIGGIIELLRIGGEYVKR